MSNNTKIVGDEVRCTCNKLLMSVKDNFLIIKCSRCKRYVVVRTKGVKSVDMYDMGAVDLEHMLNVQATDQ